MPGDLIALLTPASPVLANALTGPNAAIAISLLGRAVVGDDSATPDAIAGALKNGDPDNRLKIARAEADFQRNTAGLQFEIARLPYQAAEDARQDLIKIEADAANDRANARQRQQVTNDRTNAYLAYIVTIGFLLTILLVAKFDYAGSGNPVLQTLLGILGTGWASMMAFYFGSSVGSREKTAILGEASTPPKLTSVAPAAGAEVKS